MGTIDRSTAPWHGPLDPNAGAGPREPMRERMQEPRGFQAWLEEAPDAQRMEQAPMSGTGLERAAGGPDTVASALADGARAVGVIYPWALHAHAYLSQLGVQEGDDAGGAMTMGTFNIEQASLPGVDARLSSMQAVASSHASNTDEKPPFAVAITTAMRGINGSSIRSDAAATDAAGTAVAVSWSERLLRRTIDAGGNATWWLRDYGMSAAEQEALTHSLLSQPLHQRPSRIVINGVEVWRAPDSLSEH